MAASGDAMPWWAAAAQQELALLSEGAEAALEAYLAEVDAAAAADHATNGFTFSVCPLRGVCAGAQAPGHKPHGRYALRLYPGPGCGSNRIYCIC